MIQIIVCKFREVDKEGSRYQGKLYIEKGELQ